MMRKSIFPTADRERSDYLTWLYDQSMPDGMHNGYSYYIMLKTLAETLFEAVDPRDVARNDDALEMRIEYLEKNGKMYLKDVLFIHPDKASVLEVLIAFAKRAAFEVCGSWSQEEAFVDMLRNAGLLYYDDDKFVAVSVIDDVKDMIGRIINREYGSDGSGGFFPLINPKRDQIEMPMWEQLQDYLYEHFDV